MIEIPNLTRRFHTNAIEQLKIFYGLDIRPMGSVGPSGVKGFHVRKWVLAGEWRSDKYIDYIAERLQKLGAL